MDEMTSGQKIFLTIGLGVVGYMVYSYFTEKKASAAVGPVRPPSALPAGPPGAERPAPQPSPAAIPAAPAAPPAQPARPAANLYPPSQVTSGGRFNTDSVQVFLNKLGTKPQLVVDGVNGPATAKAVKELQLAFGLPQTGLVDVATADMMNSVQIA